MEYLVKDEILELKYEHGKGAVDLSYSNSEHKTHCRKMGFIESIRNYRQLQNWQYQPIYNYGTRQTNFY